ncbi:hypothetical protein QN397_15575 [Variovorax sp. RTB1]|uniref:hypothetical protein n=1 Tax=Variovorax sp. RTB1 TaxID=3048631 RepID=UPI002B23DA23|nr:hypothetical protein [Variovorax sp. RTB1]MEB0112777.1 hypothetical protein [Variovorax sp. RTB1]
MNCKPGDLAIMISAPPRNPQLLGTIVKVLKVSPGFKFEEFGGVFPGCLVRPPRTAWGDNGKLSDTGWVQDWRLRPIRDPGDDAKDGSLCPQPLEMVLP